MGIQSNREKKERGTEGQCGRLFLRNQKSMGSQEVCGVKRKVKGEKATRGTKNDQPYLQVGKEERKGGQPMVRGGSQYFWGGRKTAQRKKGENEIKVD